MIQLNSFAIFQRIFNKEHLYGHRKLNSTLIFNKNILQPSFSSATLIIKIFHILKKKKKKNPEGSSLEQKYTTGRHYHQLDLTTKNVHD